LDVEGLTNLIETEGAGKKFLKIEGFDTGQWHTPTPNVLIENMCFGVKSFVFVQVACTFPDEEIITR